MFFSYEGTGRSLSLKVIQQLRQQNATYGSASAKDSKVAVSGKSEAGSSATGKKLQINNFAFTFTSRGVAWVSGARGKK